MKNLHKNDGQGKLVFRRRFFLTTEKMQIRRNEEGFSYIEIIISILIMTIGLLAMMSAISIGVIRARESEQRNIARQFTTAALESIFATRDLLQVDPDLRQENPLRWNAVANNTTATPQGIFLTGFNPIRRDSGIDQIEGTADDACPASSNCMVGTYTNTSGVIAGFQREIIITDLPDPPSLVIRRRRIVVNVRYPAGQTTRTETVSTVIADLLAAD